MDFATRQHKMKILVKNKQTKTSQDNAVKVLDSQRYNNNEELLARCQDAYDRMSYQRNKMMRATNYAYGRQWEDLIVDPDVGYGQNKMIKEKDYITRQGKVPIKYNVIGKSRKSIVGLYVNNKSEPHAIAHDRDEQKLSDMMTVALQYAYGINEVPQLNARLLDECFCTGLFCRSVYYRYNSERQMTDVYIQNESPYKIFFNTNVIDSSFRDLSLIGAIRDLKFDDLCAAFANKEGDVKKLSEEYNTPFSPVGSSYNALEQENLRQNGFLSPKDTSMCRVFEVWTKETKKRYYCHDTAKGEECYREIEEKEAIDAENERRILEMQGMGYPPETASLIEYEWYIDTYWYVRYLTPRGNCILEMESPYDHGSHPFTIGGYPMINGETFSPAEELIDTQRVINRTLSQIDFLRQNGAKNVLMCPIDAVPDGITPQDFAKEYTKSNSVLFFSKLPDGQLPFQLKSQPVQAGDIDVVNLYLQLNDQISGVTGALRGEQATSNTPASLYAQEAQNSTNNIADFLSWFNTCVKQSDTKMMKVIQQFYTDEKYIPLAGKDFSEEAKWYNPTKIRQSEFDITVVQGVETPTYRMAMENTLFQSLQTGLIDLKMYLEASAMPYADKLLNIINRKEKEMAAAQQAGGQPTGLGPEAVGEMQQLMQQQ